MFPQKFLDEVVRRADANLLDQLVKSNHVVEQQNKVIANLTEALALAQKKAPRTTKRTPRMKLKRNKSWRKSALIGLREGIWLAPSTVLWEVGVALCATLVCALKLVGAVIRWPIALPVTLIVGFCGYLVENEEAKREPHKI